MDFISVIKAICQVIGGFGIINADGEFDIVYLSNEISEHTLTAMSGFELEPYTVKAIDKVVVRSEETDIGGTYGDGDNAYIVQGNFLCFGMDAEAIQTVAAGLYANVSGYSWKPCLFEMGISNPIIGCDGIRYKVVTSQGDEFETYIFNSYLSGVQMFDQELESFGTEYRDEVVADDYTNNFILAYRVMKLKATVDGFDLQIENKVGEDEVITKINASAEKITISSSKIDIAGLVKFINEDNGDKTLIDGGKIKTDNLVSISANIGGFVFVDGNMRYLQEDLYKYYEDGTSEGTDIVTKWYSSGFSATKFEQDTDEKVLWFGAHPITSGEGLDDNNYYTEDNLFYPFYITADGKIISKGEENTTIFGSGHNYAYNLVNFSWTDSGSIVVGNESAELKAGYLLLNDLIKFSGKGFDYNDTNILAFNTNGIYSPKINAENISAKESISTSNLYVGDVTVGSGGIYSNGDITAVNNIKVKGTANYLEQDYMCFQTSNGGGSAGYWKLCTITTTGTYVGGPIKFTLSRRSGVGELLVMFNANSSIAGCNVTTIRQNGQAKQCYIIKTSSSTSACTFDIYVAKEEAYGALTVTRVNMSYYVRTRVAIAWSGAYVSALPDGTTAAEWAHYDASTDYHVNYLGASGGITASNTAFPALTLTRAGSSGNAGIKFINSLGTLGALGMAAVSGSLTRYASDLATGYTILDSGNYTSYAQPKITGSANADNGYLRIPSLKIQIAWKKVSTSASIGTAYGSGYETASAISLGNWAAAFSAAPAVSYSASSATSMDLETAVFDAPTATSAGSVFLIRNTMAGTRTLTVYVIGIGTYS